MNSTEQLKTALKDIVALGHQPSASIANKALESMQQEQVSVVSFKDMADATDLRATVDVLLPNIDRFWLDQSIKQAWEIKDFLEQIRSSEYLGLSVPQQNLLRKVINTHNRWVHNKEGTTNGEKGKGQK